MVEPEGPAIMVGDSNQDGVRLATPAASCCTSTGAQEKFCSGSGTEVYPAGTEVYLAVIIALESPPLLLHLE